MSSSENLAAKEVASKAVALMNAALQHIEDYKDTEEVDSRALAEECIEDAIVVLGGVSAVVVLCPDDEDEDEDEDYEGVECGDCNATVTPDDPYFATPCGTFCSSCMREKHALGCGICASEFDIEAEES